MWQVFHFHNKSNKSMDHVECQQGQLHRGYYNNLKRDKLYGAWRKQIPMFGIEDNQ